MCPGGGGVRKKMCPPKNNFWNSPKVTSLPDCKSRVQLAAEFRSFFVQKIQKIDASLGGGVVSDLSATPAAPDGCVLDELQCPTHEEIKKLIMSSPTKSCGLDHYPPRF